MVAVTNTRPDRRGKCKRHARRLIPEEKEPPTGARVVKHNGEVLTPANIGIILATRDLMTDMRAADPFRQGGGRPFSKADRSRFLDAMEREVRAR